jgi:hypothetical protein
VSEPRHQLREGAVQHPAPRSDISRGTWVLIYLTTAIVLGTCAGVLLGAVPMSLLPLTVTAVVINTMLTATVVVVDIVRQNRRNP